MPTAAWAAILVAVLAALTVYGWFFQRGVFLVVACHNAIWAGAIALIGTGLITYSTVGPAAWLTLACGLVGFNVGTWLTRWPLRFTRRDAPAEGTAQRQPVPALLGRSTMLALLGVYAVAFAVYLVVIAQRFGLALLVTSPAQIRGASGESYLESVPLPVRLLLYLAPLLFVVLGYREAMDKPFPVAIRAILMVAIALSMLALLQRTNLFVAILWLVALLLSQARRAKSKDVSVPRGVFRLPGLRRLGPGGRLGVGIVALAVGALVAFQVVGIALVKNGEQAIDAGNVSEPLVRSGLTAPFTYYTGGVVAFLVLTESTNYDWPEPHVQVPGGPNAEGDNNPQLWGLATFAPVLKFVPGAPEYPGLNPFIDIGIPINVFTWLEPYYRDFRVVGVAVFTLLSGFVMGWLYRRRFQSTRIFWIQAALLSTVFLATFANKIDTQFIAVVGFVILLSLPWRRWIARVKTRGPVAESDGDR